MRSIGFRLMIAFLFSLTLFAGLGSFAAYHYGKSAANEAYDKLLSGAALQVAERISVINGQTVVDLPVSAFELLALAREDRIFHRIIEPSGVTISGYDDLPLPKAVPTPLNPTLIYDAFYRGEAMRLVILERQLSERGLSGAAQIIIAQTTRDRSKLALDITLKALLLIGFISFGLLLLSLAGVKYVLAPIKHIEQALSQKNPNDLSPLTIETPQELETVVAAINRFMARLDKRISSIQSFVAETAHQLRTPIAALRAQAEMAQMEEELPRLKSINEKILNRAVGISRLTDQLLSQALISHQSDTVNLQPVNLVACVQEAARELRQVAEPRENDFILTLPKEPLLIMGDAFSLIEAIKNLMSNARLHGAAPFEAEVGKLTQDTAFVRICDHGKGIADEDQKLIGEKFARLSGQTNRAGLGLAIVSDVARFHNGRLIPAFMEDGRFSMTLHFPIVATHSQDGANL